VDAMDEEDDDDYDDDDDDEEGLEFDVVEEVRGALRTC
jgi:hypothetical protein